MLTKNHKVIGKGTFTTCYRAGNSNKVLIKSDCPAKECMSLGWFGNSRLFPKVKQELIDNKGNYFYSMPYYKKQKSLKNSLIKKDYELYKFLRGFHVTSGYHKLYKAFSKIKNRRVRTALLEALDGLANFGDDITFEISPRNVAVSNTGRLILLDCFFFINQLNEKRGYRHA